MVTRLEGIKIEIALALALLVPRVLADYPHHILALHNLAAFTKSFY
jgi:hypothetical protein